MAKIYFAGSRQGNDERILELKSPRLYSYYNDYKAILLFAAEKERGPLLVDSGAFSVARGKHVDIDEYIQFINDHPEIENFIELDVIPYPVLNRQTAEETAQKSWENYLYMIERVNEPKKILPVFHFGEDIKYLRQILEFKFEDGTGIPFMCIGGRHGVSTEKQEKYFDTIFETVHSSSNPDIKIHALGMTVLSTLEKFPFYSCDSTSHLVYAMYGLIMTPKGAVNLSDKNHNPDNYKYFRQEEKDWIKEYVEEMGYTVEELATDTTKRIFFNIDYFTQWQESRVYRGRTDFTKKKGLF